MLDVHPIHPSVHTWKDFLIHIVTITIGLLIAIGLEQAVEAVHHQNLRREARESIRREISDNEATLKEDLQSLQRQRTMLERDIQILRQLAAQQKGPIPTLNFDWQWSGMDDAAWQTAKETATVALFPAAELHEDNNVYVQQTLVNDAGFKLVRDLTDATVPIRVQPDQTALTAAQIDELERSCAVSINQIQYIESLSRALARNYAQALNDR